LEAGARDLDEVEELVQDGWFLTADVTLVLRFYVFEDRLNRVTISVPCGTEDRKLIYIGLQSNFGLPRMLI